MDDLLVAPRVGAWIETTYRWILWCVWLVAPHVGAWIETSLGRFLLIIVFSRPSHRGVDRNGYSLPLSELTARAGDNFYKNRDVPLSNIKVDSRGFIENNYYLCTIKDIN